MSGGRGCLGDRHLGVRGQVWELRFLPSFASLPRGNCSPKKSGKTPGSATHPSSRHPRLSDCEVILNKIALKDSLGTFSVPKRSQIVVQARPRKGLSLEECS